MGAIGLLHLFPAAQQLSAPLRPRSALLRSSEPKLLLCSSTLRVCSEVSTVNGFPAWRESDCMLHVRQYGFVLFCLAQLLNA